MLYIAVYCVILFIFTIYSFALVDPNITFVQSPLWVAFRDQMVSLGYYMRDVSWIIYLVLLILLFIFHFILVKNHAKLSIRRLVIAIGVMLLFSYPFLSHDFFNYMFDARIFTYYGKNPYLFKAMDFPADQWTRFMHWTHRTYPYGPSYLVLSFIPSFLGLGKFTPTFILFKACNIGLYIVSVILLSKLNKKWAVVFATHPLIIIEGLINGHNDMVALCLAVIGIYFLEKNKNIWGRILLVVSGGIKYITMPLIFIKSIKSQITNLPAGRQDNKSSFDKLRTSKSHKNKPLSYLNLVLLVIVLFVLLYLSLKMEIQPWYFLVLFSFLPLFPKLLSKLNIFFFGLLASYYPYIRLGGWDSPEKVDLKHQIIFVFFCLNLVYLLIYQTFLKKVLPKTTSIRKPGF